MDRQAIESTSIRSIGYEPINSILEVEFKNGGIYQYFNVPPDVYEELMNTESHGIYFHENIKEIYQYAKVDEE